MRPLSFPDSPTWYDEKKISESRRKYEFDKEASYKTITYLSDRQKEILNIKLDSRTSESGFDLLDATAPRKKKKADAILAKAPKTALYAVEKREAHDQNYYKDYVADEKASKIENELEPSLNDELASLRAVFTPDYGTARRELISLIGQYCSYCELPVGSRLAIEHRLPKHYFPHLGFRWSNFLLACDSCNAIKGAKPNQWTRLIGSRYQSIDDVASRFDDVANYAWPHLVYNKMPEQGITPLPFLVQLCKVSGKTLTGGEPLDWEQVQVFIRAFRAGKLVPKDGYFEIGDWRNKVKAAACLVPNPASPIEQSALKAMIELVDLNRITGKTGIASIDRRVELRTLALFTAWAVRSDLDVIYGHRPNEEERQRWRNVIADLVAVTGFWTVWMNVFPEIFYGDLCEAFPGTLRRNWSVNGPDADGMDDDEDVPMDAL